MTARVFALALSGGWRLVFRFEDGDVYDVEVTDYHRKLAMDAIGGSIPAEQIQRVVERLRRDPPHPGALIREFCLGDSTASAEAARQLGLDRAELERILAGEHGISPDLAIRMEALGWGTADLWVKLQSGYDLALARRRAQRAA